ncbi:MAG: hypothetical protein PVI23_00720 [Maricaulaceae bacterium]
MSTDAGLGGSETASVKPPDAKKARITIRRFEPSDWPEVRPLYEANFSKLSLDRLERRWNWQFVDNPACARGEPRAWVADEGGRVVAYMGSYPLILKVRDQEFVIRWQCDFTAEIGVSRRDPTLAMRMVRAFLNDPELVFHGGTEITVTHERLRLRLRHREVHNCTELLTRPMRGGAMARYWAEQGRLPGWIGRQPVRALFEIAAATAVAMVNPLLKPARDKTVSVRRVESPGEEFDALWSRIKDKFTVSLVRDRTFVQWRFFEDPCFDHAVFGAYGPNGDLIGYIAVRADSKDDLLRGRIMDLFCDPDSPRIAKSLLRAGLDHLAALKVDVVSCRGLCPKLRAVVRKSFYFPPPGSRSEVPALLLWTGPEEYAETIYDGSNWHLTRADGSGALDP